MIPSVTAVLVVHGEAPHLERTLEAVRAQRRAVDGLAVVACRATDAALSRIEAAGPDHIVTSAQELAFGAAVREGVRVLPDGSEDDMLWLLADGTAPAPGSLDALVAELETAPSVVVAAPKLVHWHEPDRIASMGESMTRLGAAVDLVGDELDQGQHDGMSDVIGASSRALLVRRSTWRDLDGFDPALPWLDDGLDLGVRARLAGGRVAVVPAAAVRVAERELPGGGATGAVARRRAHRVRRSAQLHRRFAYAPAPMLPVHWIALLPLAVLRSAWHLLTKAPGAIPGEWSATARALVAFVPVAASRRRIRAHRSARWSAIAPLRVPPDELRRRRAQERDARRVRARGTREEVQFIAGGGGWTLLVAVLASIGLFTVLVGARGLAGGGLLPLAPRVGELWSSAGYGWRDVGTGFVGAADPFASVLALLGSVTPWSPSFAMVLLWVAAIPLAAVGAWYAAARLTDRAGIRAVVALAWAVAPPLVVALGEGRPGAVLAHVLLPWLVWSMLAAMRSWPASAASALLFAAVIACAPSLAPALVLGWLAAVVATRHPLRYLGIPVPALVLAAPLVIDQVARGTALGLLADPGLPVSSGPTGGAALLFAFPADAYAAWAEPVAALAGAAVPPWLPVAVLLAPLGLLAAAALFVRGARAGLGALAVALAGFVTAALAGQIAIATAGEEAVRVWTGAGLSLYWLGLLGALLVTLRAMGRYSAVPGSLALLGAAVAVLPIGIAIATGSAALQESEERTVPAFVQAAAAEDPRVATLRLVPQEGGGLRAVLEHGAGTTLNDQSTLAATAEDLDPDQLALAELAGNLASRTGYDTTAGLDRFGIRFVLLAPPAIEATRAQTTAERAEIALDDNAALVPVGDTDFGRLYRYDAAEAGAPATAVPADAGGWWAVWVDVVQLVVVLGTLLLAIPVGAGRERGRRRPVAPPLVDAVVHADAEAERDAEAADAAEAERDGAGDGTPDGAGDEATAPGPTGRAPDGAPAEDADAADDARGREGGDA
ncbi:glycosyltransferase family 2 protein [Agromyces sp. SYSU T00194]|uniref:glycosyltransferase family 2 protein n=1 Tax=Agromyces chitinivorans TaxID=3158560 RepID=UPI0033930F41